MYLSDLEVAPFRSLNSLDRVIMATYEERLASFQPKKPKSSKRTAINASLAKGWPHPASFKATPSSLAHAGFYFDPTADKSDNVTCFTCEHSLGAWTVSDDPFTEHLNVDAKCCWAVSRCNIELDRQKDGRYDILLIMGLYRSFWGA
jgi:Inhibitor of Apoptosis domain